MIGQTISHYKILEKLGEGGMGVVYKAYDTTLKRDVALKFLPQYLTSDRTEKERFYHEAQAASALSHQNVTTIYEISEFENQLYIAMEYVEGKTLKQLVEHEILPIKKVLDIAIQVCDGLAAAHEKGIVHRDIKSENIMLTPKGQVKIMDFGLAKVIGTTKLTKEGSTLGTAAYMSPEQAQSEEVDNRSDIFSFGVVLYELLTGKLPFRGEHHAALMYSIINEEPQPIARFNEKVTPEIERIVARTLAKDKEDRYQHTDELLAEIRHERKKLDYVKAGYATTATSPAVTISPKRRWMKIRVGISTVIVLIVLTIALVLLLVRQPVKLNPDMTIKVLDIPFVEIQYPGLSPDGKWLAFPAADANWKWDIYNMHISGGEPKRITTDSSSYLFASYSADISPNGSLIAYCLLNGRTSKNEVRLVSSLGGIYTVVVESGVSAKWRPDGERIGYMLTGYGPYLSKSGRNELWTVKPNGTDKRLEFVDTLGRPKGGSWCFDWSPDGKSIAWLRTFNDMTQEVIIRDLETGKERQLTFDKHEIDEVFWASNNQIIYSSNKSGNTNLWMIPATGGESVQITKGEGPDVGMTVSADCNKLVYYRRRTLGFIWRASLEGAGEKQLTFEDRWISSVSFSPDRQQIVFCERGLDELGKGRNIQIIDREGQNRRQLVQSTNFIDFTVWSPDGKWIAYPSRSSGEPLDSADIFLLDPLNPGSPKQLTKGRPWFWTDSRTLITIRGTRTWLFDIITDEEKPFYEDSTYAFPVAGQRYICYQDLRLEKRGIWVVPINDRTSQHSSNPKLIFSASEPQRFLISNDRSWILLWDDSGTVWKLSLPSGKRELKPVSFPILRKMFNQQESVCVSYDGKEVLYVQGRMDSKLVLIDNPFK